MRYDFLGLGTADEELDTCYMCGALLTGDEYDVCVDCRDTINAMAEDYEGPHDS